MEEFSVLNYVPNIIYTAIVILVTIFTAEFISFLFRRHEKKKGPAIHTKFLNYIIRAFILLLCIASIGSQFKGFSSALSAIMASSGIIALGASLAAQASLGNIIDGIFISIFKPFNIGDRVTLVEKNITGFVKEINLRHTVITTFNNTSYIISNSAMSSAIIENSNFHNKSFAYPIDVRITYDSDMELAVKILQDVIENHPEYVDTRSEESKLSENPMVTVYLREFGTSGIELRAWMSTADVNQSFKACSDVRFEIKRQFDANGITIPYTTIHIDNPSSMASIHNPDHPENHRNKQYL